MRTRDEPGNIILPHTETVRTQQLVYRNNGSAGNAEKNRRGKVRRVSELTKVFV